MVVGVHGDLKILGVIPARYQSSRFPGKPLIDIDGVPMIKRTFMQAKKSDCLDDLLIATDDSRISDYCSNNNMPTIMTSNDCLTGTDRLAEVAMHPKYSNYDLYINIQGDEPVIDPTAIDQLCQEYQKYGSSYQVYNLYKLINDEKQINSDTIIKVIVNEMDELMYMSRLPVPFSKSGHSPPFKQQIPVYAFTREALMLFHSKQKTINERYEDIELLRFVDSGMKLKMTETKVTSISVDVPEDLNKVLEHIKSTAQ